MPNNRKQPKDFKGPNDEHFYISQPDFETVFEGKISGRYIQSNFDNADTRWKNIENMFSKFQLEDTCEEQTSDNETKYYDSLCPQGDNQEYVAKLKEDIRNLRREYSRTGNELEDGNLIKRSFLDDLAKKKTSMARRSASTNSRDQNSWRSIKGDVWFSSSRFQDSGDRLCGGRRYSESRVDRGRKSLEKVKQKRTQSKEATSYPGREQDNYKTKKDKHTTTYNYRDLKTNHTALKGTIENSETEVAKNMYREIMKVVKEKSPSQLPYGRERMAAWLLESRMQ